MTDNNFPWRKVGADRTSVEEDANSIVGESIEAVAYVIAEGNDCDSCGPVHFSGFDVVSPVSMAVELRMSSGRTYSFIWVVEGLNYALSLGLGAAESQNSTGHRGRPLVRCDVSRSSNWERFLGREILQTKVSWCETGERESVAPWSIRVDFDHGESVVVALGRSSDRPEHNIEFDVSGLVVIFDIEVAKTFKPVAAEASAFAE